MVTSLSVDHVSCLCGQGLPASLATMVAHEAAARAKSCTRKNWLQLQPNPRPVSGRPKSPGSQLLSIGYRLIDAADVAKVSPMGDKIGNARTARELAKTTLDPPPKNVHFGGH